MCGDVGNTANMKVSLSVKRSVENDKLTTSSLGVGLKKSVLCPVCKGQPFRQNTKTSRL